ncbi:hypothetical protein OUZ56_011807 [Daphnia magna]|uniref:Uncharacterized protein n=1 Tax=Daphnia magna TaxID=35525 RepID=A0ABQ9Z165_9CRUS|nr:hypothetical protein OUZ56_011807 [Daphnia magna]
MYTQSPNINPNIPGRNFILVNVVADTESAIGSGSESHIGPGHFQLESPNLVHFCYANITHVFWLNTGEQC